MCSLWKSASRMCDSSCSARACSVTSCARTTTGDATVSIRSNRSSTTCSPSCMLRYRRSTTAGARSGNCLASATAACERSIQLVLGTLSSRIHPPRVTSSSCQRALRVVMAPSFTSARPLAVTFSAQKPSRWTALPPPDRCCTSSLVRASSRCTSAAYLRDRSRYFARRSTTRPGSTPAAVSSILRRSRIVLPVLPRPGDLSLKRRHPCCPRTRGASTPALPVNGSHARGLRPFPARSAGRRASRIVDDENGRHDGPRATR